MMKIQIAHLKILRYGIFYCIITAIINDESFRVNKWSFYKGSGDASRLNNVIDTVMQSAFLKEPTNKDLEVAPSLLNSNEGNVLKFSFRCHRTSTVRKASDFK